MKIKEVRLGSKLGGRVAEVAIAEGDPIEPGQVLVRFEASEIEARHQQALAALRPAEAELERARNGARPEEKAASRAVVVAARAQWELLKAGARAEDIRPARGDLEGAEAFDAELEQWRSRPLGETPYLILYARYEKVRHGGAVVSCAVLVVIGIDPQGKRSDLGVSVSLSEAEVHRREFLASLQARGMHGVRAVVSDDHAGLREALKSRLTGVPWQRCQFHLMKNALAFVPRPSIRAEVTASLRALLDAPDRPEAQRQLDLAVKKYRAKAPRLAEWLEANVPEGLTVFSPPAGHRRRPRTSNMLERLNEEIKRRTRVAGPFPNEASALRLVSAVLMEIGEDWESGRGNLTMGTG